MVRRFKLVEIHNSVYITATDRAALNAMLAANATEAHIKRKRYRLVEGYLEKFKDKARKATEEKHGRAFAQTPHRSIDDELKAGHSFYQLLVTAFNDTYKYDLFA